MTHHERLVRRGRIAQRVVDGESRPSVARRFGVCLRTVDDACLAYPGGAPEGIEARPSPAASPAASPVASAIASAVAAGEPMGRVSRRFHVSRAAVRTACRDRDVAIPPRGRRKVIDTFAILLRLLHGASQSELARESNTSRQRINQIAVHAASVGFDIPSMRTRPTASDPKGVAVA